MFGARVPGWTVGARYPALVRQGARAGCGKGLFAVVLLLMGWSGAGAQEVLYRTDAYTVLDDRVRQGAFEAVAKSRTEMTSTYRGAFDTNMQIGFKINGRLADMADYEQNRLLFNSQYGKAVS